MGNSNLDVSGHRNVNLDDTSFQGNLDEVEVPLEAIKRKEPKGEEKPAPKRGKKG